MSGAPQRSVSGLLLEVLIARIVDSGVFSEAFSRKSDAYAFWGSSVMRCSECRTNISPGPEFCPVCGGDLDITVRELVGWSFRSASRRLSAVAGWTFAFAGIVGLSLLGSQINPEDAQRTILASPEPAPDIVVLSEVGPSAATLNAVVAICDEDCASEAETVVEKDGYILRRRSDLPVRSEAEREEALQLRETP